MSELRPVVNVEDLHLEFSSQGTRFADVDSGRIRVDVGATGHHREDATFAAGGRLVPLGYWEGEDTGEGKS